MKSIGAIKSMQLFVNLPVALAPNWWSDQPFHANIEGYNQMIERENKILRHGMSFLDHIQQRTQAAPLSYSSDPTKSLITYMNM